MCVCVCVCVCVHEVRLDRAAVAPVLSLLAGVLMAVAHVSQKPSLVCLLRKQTPRCLKSAETIPEDTNTTERFTDPN